MQLTIEKTAAQTQTLFDLLRQCQRKGIRLSLKRGKLQIDFDQPPGIPLYLEVWKRKRELERRLRKPPGWPRLEPLPPWWEEIALAFEIQRARLHECGACGYPVAVLVDRCKQPGWYCLRCGRPASSRNGAGGKREKH